MNMNNYSWRKRNRFAAPPSTVEIVNQGLESKLEVQENHEIAIECVARNSKPASRIVWFRSNVEINPGEYVGWQRADGARIELNGNMIVQIKTYELFVTAAYRAQ